MVDITQAPVPDQNTFTVTLNDQNVHDLSELAGRRGIDANTALQQAIATAKFFSDKVDPGDKVLIKKPDSTISEVLFEKSAG